MDIREAIEFLKMLSRYFTFWKHAEKLKAAVETVEKYYEETEEIKEKQTQVKPFKMLSIDGNIEYDCPYCGSEQNARGWDKFCPCCGQAIDWSDVE